MRVIKYKETVGGRARKSFVYFCPLQILTFYVLKVKKKLKKKQFFNHFLIIQNAVLRTQLITLKNIVDFIIFL